MILLGQRYLNGFIANLFDYMQYELLRQISADTNNTVIALVRDKPATEARISDELSDRKNIFVIQGDMTDPQSLKVRITAYKILY